MNLTLNRTGVVAHTIGVEQVTAEMRAAARLALDTTQVVVERRGDYVHMYVAEQPHHAYDIFGLAAAKARDLDALYIGPTLCTYCGRRAAGEGSRWCSDEHETYDRGSEVSGWRRSAGAL